MTLGDTGRATWRGPRAPLVERVIGVAIVVVVFGLLGWVALFDGEIAQPGRVLVLAVGVLGFAVPYLLVTLLALRSGTGVDLTADGVVVRRPGGSTIVPWGSIATIRGEGIGPSESIIVVARSEADISETGLRRLMGRPRRTPRVPGYLAITPGTVHDTPGLDAALRGRLGLAPRPTVEEPTPPSAAPASPAQPATPVAHHLDMATFVAPPFPRVRVREGYDIGEVDAFAATVLEKARHRPPVLTVDEVESVVFTPVRIREGYDMGSVDRWLDRVVAELRRR